MIDYQYLYEQWKDGKYTLRFDNCNLTKIDDHNLGYEGTHPLYFAFNPNYSLFVQGKKHCVLFTYDGQSGMKIDYHNVWKSRAIYQPGCDLVDFTGYLLHVKIV